MFQILGQEVLFPREIEKGDDPVAPVVLIARLTPETCADFPNIPFHKIVGMCNRVVHDYGQVDFAIAWETGPNSLAFAL